MMMHTVKHLEEDSQAFPAFRYEKTHSRFTRAAEIIKFFLWGSHGRREEIEIINENFPLPLRSRRVCEKDFDSGAIDCNSKAIEACALLWLSQCSLHDRIFLMPNVRAKALVPCEFNFSSLLLNRTSLQRLRKQPLLTNFIYQAPPKATPGVLINVRAQPLSLGDLPYLSIFILAVKTPSGMRLSVLRLGIAFRTNRVLLITYPEAVQRLENSIVAPLRNSPVAKGGEPFSPPQDFPQGKGKDSLPKRKDGDSQKNGLSNSGSKRVFQQPRAFPKKTLHSLSDSQPECHLEMPSASSGSMTRVLFSRQIPHWRSKGLLPERSIHALALFTFNSTSQFFSLERWMRKIGLQGIASAISKNRFFVDTQGNQEISREKNWEVEFKGKFFGQVGRSRYRIFRRGNSCQSIVALFTFPVKPSVNLNFLILSAISVVKNSLNHRDRRKHREVLLTEKVNQAHALNSTAFFRWKPIFLFNDNVSKQPVSSSPSHSISTERQMQPWSSMRSACRECFVQTAVAIFKSFEARRPGQGENGLTHLGGGGDFSPSNYPKYRQTINRRKHRDIGKTQMEQCFSLGKFSLHHEGGTVPTSIPAPAAIKLEKSWTITPRNTYGDTDKTLRKTCISSVTGNQERRVELGAMFQALSKGLTQALTPQAQSIWSAILFIIIPYEGMKRISAILTNRFFGKLKALRMQSEESHGPVNISCVKSLRNGGAVVWDLKTGLVIVSRDEGLLELLPYKSSEYFHGLN